MEKTRLTPGLFFAGQLKPASYPGLVDGSFSQLRPSSPLRDFAAVADQANEHEQDEDDREWRDAEERDPFTAPMTAHRSS